MSCFVDVRGINYDGNIYRKAQAVIATARRKVLLVQTGPAPNPNNASDTINQWRSVYIVNQTTHFELQICRLDKGASDPELVTTEAFKAPPLPWLWSGIPCYCSSLQCSMGIQGWWNQSVFNITRPHSVSIGHPAVLYTTCPRPTPSLPRTHRLLFAHALLGTTRHRASHTTNPHSPCLIGLRGLNRKMPRIATAVDLIICSSKESHAPGVTMVLHTLLRRSSNSLQEGSNK